MSVDLFRTDLLLHQRVCIEQELSVTKALLTTMCHEISVKIQELVPDFRRTRTLVFVILKVEKRVDLKV